MSEISREPSLATLIQQAGGAMNLVRNAPPYAVVSSGLSGRVLVLA